MGASLEDIKNGASVRGIASAQPVHVVSVDWIGDQALWPHLSMLLKGGAVDVELRFGEAIAPSEAGSRKMLAARSEAAVRALTVASRHLPSGS